MNNLTTMSSTETIGRKQSSKVSPVAYHTISSEAAQKNSARTTKMQSSHQKAQSLEVRPGNGAVQTRPTQVEANLVESKVKAHKPTNSVSKISLLANKLDKIKMYNQEARIVQKHERAVFQRQIMQQYEPIFEKDISSIMGVPKELCAPNIQQKFIDAKRNMISRRIQNMIEHRTMLEWQLPQLKPKVLKMRENGNSTQIRLF